MNAMLVSATSLVIGIAQVSRDEAKRSPTTELELRSVYDKFLSGFNLVVEACDSIPAAWTVVQDRMELNRIHDACDHLVRVDLTSFHLVFADAALCLVRADVALTLRCSTEQPDHMKRAEQNLVIFELSDTGRWKLDDVVNLPALSAAHRGPSQTSVISNERLERDYAAFVAACVSGKGLTAEEHLTPRSPLRGIASPERLGVLFLLPWYFDTPPQDGAPDPLSRVTRFVVIPVDVGYALAVADVEVQPTATLTSEGTRETFSRGTGTSVAVFADVPEVGWRLHSEHLVVAVRK